MDQMQYNVTGMSCASCSAHVEKAVQAVRGVTEVSVSLLTNSMRVTGDASPEEVIAAVEKAGYGASLCDVHSKTGSPRASAAEDLVDRETPRMVRRLIASIVILLPLLYVSMGHMMWGWMLPASFAGNPIAIGLYEMLLTILIMVINQKFFVSGFSGLIHRAPNMDTLVSMGASASFAYSTWALFAMTAAQMRGGVDAAAVYLNDLYFDSAAMILTLITIGKTLEAFSKGRTTDALRGLMQLTPRTAQVIRDGTEVTLDIDRVRIGDVFVVRPGETIPVDGVVLEGISAVDESTLSGESIPVDKTVDSFVSAGTINRSGFLRCRAQRVGEDTTLSQIIQMVRDAAETKAPIAKVADRVSGIFVPAVLLAAVLTLVIWIFVGQTFGFCLSRAVSVLVISCPCALGLATPVAIMVGSGKGARSGILFKNAVCLEQTGKVDIVVLDKTGTVTTGNPSVTDVYVADGVTQTHLLSVAGALEADSEHPLAKAVMEYIRPLGIRLPDTEEFQAVVGGGVTALAGKAHLSGGSLAYISSLAQIPEPLRDLADRLAGEGKTPLLFAEDGEVSGLIAVADEIKEEASEAVRQLKAMGLAVLMLTGDNARTARAIGDLAGIDHVISDVLPGEKETVIRRLSERGTVAMVGDGINDAPALTRAEIGIAIGAGSDIALDAADVVLMQSSLSDVPAAIRLSRRVLRNIRQNLFWALIYNVIGIPLAAGAWYALFGWTLNPMFCAAAMSVSSLIVVLNALRLNLVNVHDRDRDKAKRHAVSDSVCEDLFGVPENEEDQETKENAVMKKTIVINGMMCEHCEMRVKTALEALESVADAEVSHEKGTAVVSLCGDVEDAALKKAVEDADYEVTKIC